MPNLHMLIKQKSLSLPRNLVLGTFGKLLIMFSTEVNLLYLLYSKALRCSADGASCLLQNFSKNSDLDNSGISLPFFPSRTNVELHNISATPKMVKKVIRNLDSSNASGPGCIPVVILRNCELELLYILAELFNMCLKESCFPDCCKVSIFKNVVPIF